MTALAVLTAAEVDLLAACEQRIAAGLQTFIEVGTDLASIRDNRLYRAEHPTFEAYCQARWGFDRTRAQNFITAARTALEISNTDLPTPTRESQARELARVPESDRAEVWRETVERTAGKPTAAAIRAVRDERTQTPARRDPNPASGPAVATTGGPDTDHPSSPGEADARLDATAVGSSGEREAPDRVAARSGAGDDSPAGRVDPPVGLDRPGSSTPPPPVPAPIAGLPRTPEGSGPTTDPLDDPQQIEADRRQRSSQDVATALVSLLLRLDPDPIRWLTRTWQPDAYRNRDLPRVRTAFTADGLRLISKHLDTIADHLDRTGGSL